jgi:hypothetical protein
MIHGLSTKVGHQIMSNANSVVAVFESHDRAESAIRKLQQHPLCWPAKRRYTEEQCLAIRDRGEERQTPPVPHGTADEVERTRDLLRKTQAKSTTIHTELAAVEV